MKKIEITTHKLIFIAAIALFFAGVLLVNAQGMEGMGGMGMTAENDTGIDLSGVRPCDSRNPTGWRNAQTVDGVDMEADPSCDPDRPELIAAVTKGTNNVSAATLNATGLAPDAVVKENDKDGDGDPDVIHIKLEVVGINEGTNPITKFEIAPGITPSFWTFAPKATGMVTEGMTGAYLVRMPAPVIRVEQGDEVYVTLENTHYLPHTIHFHGVDHPFMTVDGEGNDGVPNTSEVPLLPGESRTYVINARTPGTMAYHCHVQPDVHVLMGLNGMFVIEENRPNNTLETFNVGAGVVRHRSVASKEEFDGEYDLHYEDVDKELHEMVQTSDDPAEIAWLTNNVYDITERTADYFLLNGRSFPYTLRESQIIVEPDKKYRLRMFNIGGDSVAVHTHGHKMLIKSLDGIDLPETAQYYRDVVDIAPAQRVDVVLNTTNDGLHSYGPGIWLMHSHAESHVTTDGMTPGGDVDTITYRSFLDENGMPKGLGGDMRLFFTPEYYQRKISPWVMFDKAGLYKRMLQAGTSAASSNMISFAFGAVGILLGAVIGGIFLRKKKVPVTVNENNTNQNTGTQGGYAAVHPVLMLAATSLFLFLLLASIAYAQGEEYPGIEMLHIMPDGSVMLGTGETLPDAIINDDGTITLPNGEIATPVLDMRSGDEDSSMEGMMDTGEIKESGQAVTDQMMQDMGMTGETATGQSNLNMPGMEGIHVMPNGHIMTGEGVWLDDAYIRDSDGMIVLGSGETIKPILDMREGGGMRRTENTLVVNENFDHLPLGCSSISGEESVTVTAGSEVAQDYPGTAFTYDTHEIDAPPCTKLTVTFVNKDHIRHQFMVHNLPTDTYAMGMFNIEVTGPGQETGTFITPADQETLFVHCGVPEHEAKGMLMELKVGGGNGDIPNVPGITRDMPGTKTGSAIPLTLLNVLWGGLGILLGLLFFFIRSLPKAA